MTNIYAFENRILLCAHCGAPLEASSDGGTVTCKYCATANRLTARSSLPTFAPSVAGSLSAAQRIANLRAQIGRKAAAPSTLAPILEGDEIPAWREREAFAVWQSSRERAANGDLTAAEELVFLTEKLAPLLIGEGDALRRRAMLQSALEALTLPRHRQLLAAALARGAVREGDSAGAERWLALCDPNAEDLYGDSAYRIVRGLVDTTGRRFADVVQVLGMGDEVPLVSEHVDLAQVLRCNALSGLGRRQEAVSLLAEGNVSTLRKQAERYPAVGIDGGLFDDAEALQRSRGAAHLEKQKRLLLDRRLQERRRTRVRVVRSLVLLVIVLVLILAGRYVWKRHAPFPIEADHGEEVILDGRTASRTGPLVVCLHGCKVVIRDADLTADSIVIGSHGDTTIDVENSKLRASEALFDIKLGAGTIRIRDSELWGERGFFGASMNRSTDVQVDRTTVRTGAGANWAVDFKGSLTLRKSKLIASASGIRSTGGEIAILDGSEVAAGGTGIESLGGIVRVEHSTVSGKIGVRALSQTEAFIAKGATIHGKEAAMDMQPGDGMRLAIDDTTKILGNWWGYGAK